MSRRNLEHRGCVLASEWRDVWSGIPSSQALVRADLRDKRACLGAALRLSLLTAQWLSKLNVR